MDRESFVFKPNVNLGTFKCDSMWLSNFRRPLHSVDLAEIWHEVLLYGPNHEMDIKKFQLFLLANKTGKCTWSAHTCKVIFWIQLESYRKYFSKSPDIPETILPSP